jgi:hypothetical protein
MNFWKVVVLVAVATVPVLLLSKRERPHSNPVVSDPDNIFENELRVD